MSMGIMVARLTSGNPVYLWVSFLLLTAFHMYGKPLVITIASMLCTPSASSLLLSLYVVC
jgi:hypothetical protein